jgi:hypothetical protein
MYSERFSHERHKHVSRYAFLMNHGFSSMNFERPMTPGYFSLKEAYRWSYLG